MRPKQCPPTPRLAALLPVATASGAAFLLLFRCLFARRSKYLDRQSERSLLVRVQRPDAYDLSRNLLTFAAEYREHYRILPGLAGRWVLDRTFDPERREAGWRSPRPV